MVDVIAYAGDAQTTLADAADEFARTYWAEPRRVRDLFQHRDVELTATFCIANGTRVYLIQWDNGVGRFSISID